MARARKKIDEKLIKACWKVQDRAKANLYAGRGVALREFVHGEGHGRSDYALYVDRQLVGVLEAKPDGTTLTEVERQTRKYVDGVPDAIPAPVTPLPFGYEATGTESRFTCFSDPEPRSRRMFGGYLHCPRPWRRGWRGSRATESPDRPRGHQSDARAERRAAVGCPGRGNPEHRAISPARTGPGR